MDRDLFVPVVLIFFILFGLFVLAGISLFTEGGC